MGKAWGMNCPNDSSRKERGTAQREDYFDLDNTEIGAWRGTLAYSWGFLLPAAKCKGEPVLFEAPLTADRPWSQLSCRSLLGLKCEAEASKERGRGLLSDLNCLPGPRSGLAFYATQAGPLSPSRCPPALNTSPPAHGLDQMPQRL